MFYRKASSVTFVSYYTAICITVPISVFRLVNRDGEEGWGVAQLVEGWVQPTAKAGSAPCCSSS